MMEEELFLERVLALLQLERDEEEQARLQERIGTPLAVLVKRGHLLRPVVVVAVRTGLAGRVLVDFAAPAPRVLTAHRFSAGTMNGANAHKHMCVLMIPRELQVISSRYSARSRPPVSRA